MGCTSIVFGFTCRVWEAKNPNFINIDFRKKLFIFIMRKLQEAYYYQVQTKSYAKEKLLAREQML